MSVTSAWYLPLSPSSRVTASSPEGAIAGSKPPSTRASSTIICIGGSSSTTKITGDSSNELTPPIIQRQRMLRGNRGFVPGRIYKNVLSRDSPDDSRTGLDILDFLAPCKAKAQFGQLPPPRAARTVVEGLIWPFSLAFGRCVCRKLDSAILMVKATKDRS